MLEGFRQLRVDTGEVAINAAARVAHRLAANYPDRVLKHAVLDPIAVTSMKLGGASTRLPSIEMDVTKIS